MVEILIFFMIWLCLFEKRIADLKLFCLQAALDFLKRILREILKSFYPTQKIRIFVYTTARFSPKRENRAVCIRAKRDQKTINFNLVI